MQDNSVFKLTKPANAGHNQVVTMRCPGCRKLVKFEPIQNVPDVASMPGGLAKLFGQRQCSDPSCRTHIFFIMHGNMLIRSYPAERIDFDPRNIPPRILATLEEALTCHAAGCYTASAIMIRKTLEELCEDRGATGSNLVQRIQELRGKLVLPEELMDALDDIRLLGNDAAHLENRIYEEIGKEEVETAVEVTKEILKAAYQYREIIERLRSLKKKTTLVTPE